MKTSGMLWFCLATAIWVAGCSGPSLVGQMKARGVSDLETGKVVIRGSEADFGSETEVTATADFIIQKVWDSVYASRPYHTWAASGYREIEFYRRPDDPQPVLTLLVNATDETHIRGRTAQDGFRCPGLHEYLMMLLEKEYQKTTKQEDDPVSPEVYKKWQTEQSYYALVEIIDAHLADRPDYNRPTKQDVLKHLGKPNWGTVMQDPKKQWAYQGSGRHVPYGDKVIFRFNEKEELIDFEWVSE